MHSLVGSSYMAFCGGDWLLRYELTWLLGFITCLTVLGYCVDGSLVIDTIN